MDKIYMMSYSADKAKIKINEFPVIRETELTVTILNGVNDERRIRKAELDKLGEVGYLMPATKPDKAYFMGEVIKRMAHSCEVATGILEVALLNKGKAEEFLREIRNGND